MQAVRRAISGHRHSSALLRGFTPLRTSGLIHTGRGTELTPAAGETLEAAVGRLGVKHVLFSWTDLFGVMRSKLVPASQAAAVAEGGAGFAGFAAHLHMTPDEPDVLATPDPSTLTVLPWRRDLAWVACELTVSGRPGKHPQCVRSTLSQQLEYMEEHHSATLKTGVELEFHLIAQDTPTPQVADQTDVSVKPCYEAATLMRSVDFVGELVESMELLGYKPYQADHEVMSA